MIENLEFRNPELPLEQRVASLVGALTLEEKIICLSTRPDVPRLGIKCSGHVEGLHGLALGGPGKWGGDDPVPTTTFPQAIGLGETWDQELVRQVAAIEGLEARYAFQKLGRGGLVIRAPNADLGRDPRWGRTEECYGEDAFFNGRMAIAFTRGLQGDHPRYWLAAALLKHFLANSNENDRSSTSSDFDDELFHDYYAAPFRMAVTQGGSRAYMAAYNAVNGIPCTVHPALKQTVETWDQDGIICTDAQALPMLVSEHESHTELPQAAADSIRAGITQFLDKEHPEAVRAAIERGLISESEIDRALHANFRVMFRLGLLDPPELVPYAEIGRDDGPPPWQDVRHAALARHVTAKSVVLLKNAGGLLPLAEQRRIAVVGPFADEVLLDWYSGTPPYTVTPAAAIRERLGAGGAVLHATGKDEDELRRVAAEAEVVVVCVGNHPTGDDGWAKVTRPSYGKEAVDRQSLDLEDEALVRLVHAVNPNTVLVLLSSFPYAINWSQEHVPAIVHLTHNSQELGHGLCDVLFGDENPGGRLVQTWPRSLDQLPPLLDYDLRRGRTYMYFEGRPLYPFGFGLSYTSFAYARLRSDRQKLPPDGAVEVSVDVSNTGSRAGDEVVQLYVRRPNAARAPRLRLRGFARISLAAGATETVTLRLEARDLAEWDPKRGTFVLEGGPLELMVGRSSAEIELRQTIDVAG